MIGLRFFVLAPMAESASIGMKLQLSSFLFGLSVLVMVLLAAAGNIINDYFDRKVDRINKPDRVIVGKSVKRRVAMVLHQSLNILAVIFTIIICWRTHLWLAIALPIAVATLLWWYSPVLKKKPLLGNITVAFCVAAVPLWTGYFEINLLERHYSDMLVAPNKIFDHMWTAMWIYAIFAFLLTLAREALKDLEDIEGDRAGGYQTMPLYSSEDMTRKYVGTILSLVFIAVAFLSFRLFQPLALSLWVAICTAVFVLIPIAVTAFKTFRAREKKHYSSASLWTKLAMGGGIVLMYFIEQWLTS